MNRTIKILFTAILIISLLVFNGVRSAYALDGSRFFTWMLFFSGLGSSFAGAITHGQANELYDEYMHSAVQSGMDKSLDKYDQKHKQSIIASRVGIGLTFSAVLISLIDASHIPQPEIQKTSDAFGSRPANKDSQFTHANLQGSDISFSVDQRF
jgi:hypothetical protein